MVNWHEVTPLSRFLAIIVFIGVIPSLFFYLGMQYQDMKETQNLMRTYDFPRLYNFSDPAFESGPNAAPETHESPLVETAS